MCLSTARELPRLTPASSMRQAARAQPDPARPKALLARGCATATAVMREFNNYALPLVPRSAPDQKKGWNDRLLERAPRLAHLAPNGHVWLMLANLALLLSIIFFGFDVTSKRNLEAIGTRAGWMALTQLPLVFLMAGKANIVARLTGTSHERLNWIHRCVARTMFVVTCIHMAYFLRSWARFDYIQTMLAENVHSRRGLGAFCTLAWLVVSSVAPVRGWRYEVFVVQHMVSAIGFLVIVWKHVPETGHVYVWLPVGLWATDRLVRWAYMAYHSLAVFHPKAPRASALACQAVFRKLDDSTTRITIRDPPLAWRPGQHAFLVCHALAPLQQHPFTISSLPSDGRLEFVVKKHGGGTRKMHEHACRCGLPPVNQPEESMAVLLDGPYGRMRPLEQFDTVVLVAGSTGASFCVPLLRDLVRRRTTGRPLVTRKIRFVWVVKKGAQAAWFAAELRTAVADVAAHAGLELDISIYVTCDAELMADIGALGGARSRASSASSASASLKAGSEKVLVEAQEKPTSCGDDGSCCCAGEVGEDGIAEEGAACCCCAPAPLKSGATHGLAELAAAVALIAGRPAVKRMVAKELEQARGESAVVVCGPSGLVQATRAAAVQLSDERAVHKGTGAQAVGASPQTRAAGGADWCCRYIFILKRFRGKGAGYLIGVILESGVWDVWAVEGFNYIDHSAAWPFDVRQRCVDGDRATTSRLPRLCWHGLGK